MAFHLRPALMSLGICWLAVLLPGADLRGADQGAEATASISQLVQQLGSNKFSQRQSASQLLREMGQAAFPALAETAKSQDRETAARALEILKYHLESEDAVTKGAAQRVLEELAETDHPLASRLAKQALKPKEPDPAQRQFQFPAPQVARIQIQVNGINKKQIRFQNGIKQIKVTEKDREIDIEQAADGSIKMQVTEKKDGKDVVKKYVAKNANDLKQKHPEAYKIYQQQFQGGRLLQQVNPFRRPLAPRNVPQAPFQNNQQQLEQAKQRLDQKIKEHRQRVEKAEAEIKTREKALQDSDGDPETHRQEIEQSKKDIETNKQSIKQLEFGKARLTDIQKRIDDIRKRVELDRAKLERDRDELKRRIEDAR